MKRRAVLMVAALALAGGACGGDDDDAADDASAESETSADTDISAETDGSVADDDSGDDNDNGSDSGDNEWCTTMSGSALDTTDFDNLDMTDPESVENAFREVVDIMDDAVDSAPDEIEDDVQVLADQFREFFDELEDADFNFLDIDPAALENPETDAASDRISEYCGFDTDDTTDTVDADSTDDTSDAGLSGEGTVRDQLLQQFTAMGMTEDQANCLVDNLDMEEVAASGADDPSMFLDLFETCDINLAELQPGG